MKDIELRGKLEKIDSRFENIDRQFARVDEKFDFLATHLLRVEEKLELVLPMVAEFREFKAFVLTTLDHHTHLLERLDQDRLACHARVDRLEGRIDRLETPTGLA